MDVFSPHLVVSVKTTTMSSNATVSKSIWNVDIGIYGFLMNPNNAVIVIAIAAFVIGIAMDYFWGGLAIAAAMMTL